MEIYLAGGDATFVEEINILKINKHRLYSYFYTGGNMQSILRGFPAHYFIDSGAFSADTQGTPIQIGQYIEFIQEYEKYVHLYANLDVLHDARRTWRNQEMMEKSGLHPLPVFHMGDPIKYLHRCVAEYDYFCIGGLAGGSNTDQRKKFLDSCFLEISRLSKNKTFPKLHGFGMTALSLIFAYPWQSVDSTSWLLTAAMGSIILPKLENTHLVYSSAPWKITVSPKSPSIGKDSMHFSNLSPIQKKIVEETIYALGFKIGKSTFKQVKQGYTLKKNENWVRKNCLDVEVIEEEGVVNDYKCRKMLNALYFKNLQDSISATAQYNNMSNLSIPLF